LPTASLRRAAIYFPDRRCQWRKHGFSAVSSTIPAAGRKTADFLTRSLAGGWSIGYVPRSPTWPSGHVHTCGEMPEWSNGAVSKTVVRLRTQGSNPCLSANYFNDLAENLPREQNRTYVLLQTFCKRAAQFGGILLIRTEIAPPLRLECAGRHPPEGRA
jgi:hypothetical protein